MKSLCALVLAVVACVPVMAQTPFPVRFVEVGETVTVPKGDYVLSRETIVRGGTLVIEAGAKIKVQSIGRPLQVAGGTLEIMGTAEDPVVIEADVGHTCGHVVTYAVNGTRPRLLVSYLDYSTTKAAAGTCFVLSATDFAFDNSTIYSASAGSPRRGCIQAGGDSVGSVAGCLLECLKEPNVVTSGIIVGNGTSQSDKVLTSDVVTINCTHPLNINNRNVAVLNGTVE